MIKYFGMPCAHCSHNFSEEDDVVVCPYCGAPHHRSCYRELGNCADVEKHDEGYAWHAPVVGKLHGQDATACKSCGTLNPKENQHCHLCGRTMAEKKTPEVTQLHLENFSIQSPVFELEVGGVSAKEISAYVGSSSYYFLTQFKNMLRYNVSISWNWPAFLFRFMYFFYRKMYAVGFAVLGLYLIGLFPSMLYSIEFLKANAYEVFGVMVPHNAELLATLGNWAPIINGYSFAVSTLCGLLANKLYMKKVISDIHKVRKGGGDPAGGSEYYAALYMLGKPSKVNVIAILLGFVLLYSSVGSYLVTILGL